MSKKKVEKTKPLRNTMYFLMTTHDNLERKKQRKINDEKHHKLKITNCPVVARQRTTILGVRVEEYIMERRTPNIIMVEELPEL